jgi:hypothetical protein
MSEKENECVVCFKKEFTTVVIPKYVCSDCFLENKEASE